MPWSSQIEGSSKRRFHAVLLLGDIGYRWMLDAVRDAIVAERLPWKIMSQMKPSTIGKRAVVVCRTLLVRACTRPETARYGLLHCLPRAHSASASSMANARRGIAKATRAPNVTQWQSFSRYETQADGKRPALPLPWLRWSR